MKTRDFGSSQARQPSCAVSHRRRPAHPVPPSCDPLDAGSCRGVTRRYTLWYLDLGARSPMNTGAAVEGRGRTLEYGSVDWRAVSKMGDAGPGEEVKRESLEEPPTKRLRRNSPTQSSRTSSQARRETWRARLRSQLLPHIICAMSNLSPVELRLDAIAVQVFLLRFFYYKKRTSVVFGTL